MAEREGTWRTITVKYTVNNDLKEAAGWGTGPEGQRVAQRQIQQLVDDHMDQYEEKAEEARLAKAQRQMEHSKKVLQEMRENRRRKR